MAGGQMGRSADGSRELTEAVGDRYGGHISDARPLITPLRIATCPPADLPTRQLEIGPSNRA
jgi:hypothetical protein